MLPEWPRWQTKKTPKTQFLCWFNHSNAGKITCMEQHKLCDWWEKSGIHINKCSYKLSIRQQNQLCDQVGNKYITINTSSQWSQRTSPQFPQKNNRTCLWIKLATNTSLSTQAAQEDQERAHGFPQNLETIQNCERYDRLEVKNAFGHKLSSFNANASIFDYQESHTPLLSFATPESKINSKLWKIWEIEGEKDFWP